jgi:hypothetical protein
MDSVRTAMRDYYRSWAREVLADGRYRPGIYCVRWNAEAIFSDMRAVYAEMRIAGDPPFWVASTQGFSILITPERVGLPFAALWQGALDVQRTWNGVTLKVDESVSRSRSPSAATQ